MIKEHLYGKQIRQPVNEQWGSGQQKTQIQPTEYTKDEQFVIACIRVAKKHGIGDPFRMAHAEGWTRDQWDAALASLETKQWEQLQRSKMIDN